MADDQGRKHQASQLWTQQVWMVRMPGGGEHVGPVSLDQIKRGIDKGKLVPNAEIARQGTDNWGPAPEQIGSILNEYGMLTDTGRHEVGQREPLPSVDMTLLTDEAAPPPPPPPLSSLRAPKKAAPPPPAASAPANDAPPPPPPPSSRGVAAIPAALASGSTRRGGPPPPGLTPSPPAASPAGAFLHPPAGASRTMPGAQAASPPGAGHALPNAPPPPLPGAAMSVADAPPPPPPGAGRPQAGAPPPPPGPQAGYAAMTPHPGAVAPGSSNYPASCPRCGSDKIMANVQLTVVGGGAVVMLTPSGERAVLTAAVCGHCGLMQLSADSPKMLWAALRG